MGITSTKVHRVLVAPLGLIVVAAALWSQEPAKAQGQFQGFGALTNGAQSSPDGYTTVRVTSLADSGAGTLRAAVSAGKRHIVFDVAGTINLQSDLNIYYPYITIDGSSAPAPGITIRQPVDVGTNIYARSNSPVHDVIIHNLRMDGQSEGTNTNVGDIWGMDGQDAAVHNIILDHITGTAASDGVFDVWGRVYDVTISWNLITNTEAALHLSMEDFVKERISFHHNVFAHNNERQVRIKYDSRADYVNNVVYGWGWYACGGAGLDIDTTFSVDPTINVVNNLFHLPSGTACGSANGAIVYSGGTGSAKAFMQGNIVPSGETDTAGTTSTPMPVRADAQVTTFPAATLGDNVVRCVGTKHRTAAEQSFLDQLSNAVGGSGGTCGTTTTPPPPAPPTNVRIVK